ncbi:MAG: hypothetical protein RIS52_226 [Pseudomonadota bacterium]|jgi:cytochrome c
MIARTIASLSLAGLVVLGAIAAKPAANPVSGLALYKMQCAMCHAVVAGKNGVGPSLAKFYGRKPALAPGFAYSPAMKAFKGKWDAATLDRFLSDPRVAVPGTKMTYLGQKDPTKRADLIAYLATLR